MPLSVQEIIWKYCQGQFGIRPEFYSGRGNSTGDLSNDTLKNLHKGITAEIGVDAATQFVAMVNDLTQTGDVSATTFLIALQRLESNGWVSHPSLSTSEALAESAANELRRTGSTEASQAGLLQIMGGFTSRTPASFVTGAFLREHAGELPKTHDLSRDGQLATKANRKDHPKSKL